MRICAIFLFVLFAFARHAEAEQLPNYEIVARLLDAPGNVTVTASGRIIMSQHQFYEPRYSVVERESDGSLSPFPNKELNNRDRHSDLELDSVLGIRSDTNGVVWMLDNGMRSGVTPKLVGWDTKANKLHRVIYLPVTIAPKDAFVNDFAIDNKHNRIFIVDPAGGANAAFIVVDMETGAARRVLEGHPSERCARKGRSYYQRTAHPGEGCWGPTGSTAHRRESGHRGFAK